MITTRRSPGDDQTDLDQLERGHIVQQKLPDFRILRHPITGELPAGFRQPRKTRGEVGLQPFYRIAGGAPEDETPEEKAAREKREAEDSEKKFSQAELSAKLTEEKRQGERAAARKIMETLGFTTIEEAEQFIKDKRAADDKAKSDAEKAAEEVAREKAASEKARREADAEKRNATIERTLVKLGVNTGEDDDDDGDLPDAVILLSQKLEADADVDDIRTAAKALKERRPELFDGEVTTDPKKKAATLPGGKRGTRKTPEGVKPGASGRAYVERRGWDKSDKD
jgi:hypothetical protein